ncbi:hypothetical protein L1887_48370 [Cichorium endivia]|nr:hypothetical protein L1887_48370 [Cichorium endivia]
MPARFRGEPGKIAVSGCRWSQTTANAKSSSSAHPRRSWRAVGLMRNRIFECSRMQTKSRWASQLLDSGALEIPLSNAARVASRPRSPLPCPRSDCRSLASSCKAPRIAAPATSLLSTMLIDLFQTHRSALE